MNSSRSLLSLTVLFCIPFCSILSAQPVHNPVTTFYPGLDQYLWTDNLVWDNMITTAATPDDGLDDLAVVQKEIETLSAQGGGVLYFPAGTYDFSDDLIVFDGVVLRGMQPGDGFVADNLDPDRDPANPVDEIDNAKSTLFSLDTKFEFPKFEFDPTANDGAGNDRTAAFKAIRLNDPYLDSNLGICWIDINRARIEWIEYGEDENGMASSYWGYFGVDWDPANDFDGPTNLWRKIKARNWVVFGNRINNAARWDNRPGVAPPVGSQDPWTIWPKRISAQIDTFNYENNLVANNRLMDKHYYDWDNSKPNGEQPGDSIDDFLMPDYKAKNGSVIGDIWFNYTAGHGIKMNRSIGLDGNDIPYTPERFPMLYRRGVVCRDNWTFVTRRVGIYVGGDGLECIGNYRIDVSFQDGDLRKQAWVKPNGDAKITFAGNTLENRGYDITGMNVKCNYNFFEVHRSKMLDTSYYSTDGEGILHQEVGGGTPVDRWQIYRNVGNAYIGIYKSRDIRRLEIRENTLTEVPIKGPNSVYVVADTNGGPYQMEDVQIVDNTSADGMDLKASAGVNNVDVIGNDVIGEIRFTLGMNLQDNTGTLSQYSKEDEIPSGDYDFLPDGTITSPVDGMIVPPGETLTFTVQASDGPDSPLGVEIWRDLVKEGEALAPTDAGVFTLEVNAPQEIGTHYYFLKVDGSPDHFWSGSHVIKVAEAAPYEPVGWIDTAWGMIEDSQAPWFYSYATKSWILAEDFEIAKGADAGEFYFYDFNLASWFWSSGQTQGIIYRLGGETGWNLPLD